MNLLIVSEPGCYGVLMYVRSFIRFLHAHHPEIVVDYAYSSRRGSPELSQLVGEIEARGGETVDLGVSNAPQPRDLRAVSQILAIVRRRRPAVIHAHSSKAGALVRLLAFLPGFPPVVYTPHGYYGMSRRGGVKDGVFDSIESLLGRVGWTHNVSIHECEFARRNLGLPPQLLLMIFSGIDLAAFRQAGDEEKLAGRRKLGLPEKGRLLVTVGRVAYEKNYENLYAALDRVLPGANWSFAHAGEGSAELREGLCPEARARAFSFQFLEDPATLYRAADGFALVSRSEAFGLAAYEALACGLPLILTATTGLLSLRELDFEGIQWLPNPADCGDISGEIAAALRAWEQQRPFDSAPRRKRVEQWFDADVQFGKLTGVLEYLAGGGRDPGKFADHLPKPLSTGGDRDNVGWT